MDYFDGSYFSPTYFDTADAVSASHQPRGPRRPARSPLIERLLVDDEELLVMT